MPATPPCGDSCDRKHASGNCPGSKRRKSIPIAMEFSLETPGVNNMCQAFLIVAEIGKMDHLPAAVLLHHMMDRT
eukprot:1100384-Amphidinium_carterae.1